jgi:hypothetical protein
LNTGLHLSERGLKQLEKALTEWAGSVAWKPLNKIKPVMEIIKNNAFSYKWLLALGELHNPTFGLRAFLQDLDLAHLVPPWSFWEQGQLPEQWPKQSAQGLFHLSDNLQAQVRCTDPNNNAMVPYYQACEVKLVLDNSNCAPRLTAVYSGNQVVYLPFVPLEKRDDISVKNSQSAISYAIDKGWVKKLARCTAFANLFSVEQFSVEQFSSLSFQGYIPERGQFAFNIDFEGLKIPFSFGIEGLHIQAPKWAELTELEKFQRLLANKLQLPEDFSPPAKLLPNIEQTLKWSDTSYFGLLKVSCQKEDNRLSCQLNITLNNDCQVNWNASTGQVTPLLILPQCLEDNLKTAMSQQLGLPDWNSLENNLKPGIQIITDKFQFSSDWEAISMQLKFFNRTVGSFTIPIEIGFNEHVDIKTNIGEFNHSLENLFTRLKLVTIKTRNLTIQQCEAFEKQAKEKLTTAVNNLLGYAKFSFDLVPGCPDSLYDTDAYNLNNQNAIFGITLDRAAWKLCLKGIRYNLGKKSFDFSQASFCNKEKKQLEDLKEKVQEAMAGLSGGFITGFEVTNYYFAKQALILNYQTQIDLGEVGKLLKMSPQTISGQFTLPFKKGGVFDASVNFDQVFEKGIRHLLFSKIEKALQKLGNQGLDLFQLRFELAFKQLQYDEKQQQFLINFKVFDENRLGLETDRKNPLFKDQVRIDRHARIHWNKQGFQNALVKAFAKKSGFSDILSNLVSIPSAGITVEKTEPVIEWKPFAFTGIRFLASFEAPKMLANLLEDANVFPVKVGFLLDSNGLHAENFEGISIPLAGCIPIPPVAVEPSAIHLSDNAVNLRGVVTAFECETKHLAQLKANIEIPFNAKQITTTGDLILLDYIPAGESTVTTTFAPPEIKLNIAIGGMLSDIISLQGNVDLLPLKLSGEVDAKLFGYEITKAILNAELNPKLNPKKHPAQLQVEVTMDMMLVDFQGDFMMGGTPRLDLEATVNLVIANPSVALNVRESYVGVGLDVWGSGISFTISSLDGLTADSLLALFKLNFGILTPENLLKAFEAILSGKFSINGFGSFSAKSGKISASSGEGGDESGEGGDEPSNGLGDYSDLKSHLTQKTPESKPLPPPDKATESQYAAEAESVSSLSSSESAFRLRLQPEDNAVRLCVTYNSAPCTDKNTFAWTNVKVGDQQHLNTKNGKANTKGYVMGYGENLFAHIIRHDDPKTQCTDAALHWFVSTAPVTTEKRDATKNLDSFLTGHLNLKQWHYPSSQSGFCYDQLEERLGGNSKMPRLRRRALNRMLFDIGQVLAVSSQIKKNESQRDQFFPVGEIIQGVVELEDSLISSVISNSKVSLIVQRAANPHLNDTADMLTIYTAGWREEDQMRNGAIVFPIYGASELLGNDSLHQHSKALENIHDQLLKLYDKWWRDIEPEWQKHKENAEKSDQCFVARPQFITRLTRVGEDLMLETPVGLYQGASFWYKYTVGFGADFKQVKAFKPSLPSGGCLEHSIPLPLPEMPPVLPHPKPIKEDPSIRCWQEKCGGGVSSCRLRYFKNGQNVNVWQYIDQDQNQLGCQNADGKAMMIKKFVTLQAGQSLSPVLTIAADFSKQEAQKHKHFIPRFAMLVPKDNGNFCETEIHWYRPKGAKSGQSDVPLTLKVPVQLCREDCTKEGAEKTGIECINKKLTKLLAPFATEVGHRYSLDSELSVKIQHLYEDILIYELNGEIKGLSRNSPVRKTELLGYGDSQLSAEQWLCFAKIAHKDVTSKDKDVTSEDKAVASEDKDVDSAKPTPVTLLPKVEPGILGFAIANQTAYVVKDQANCSGKFKELAKLDADLTDLEPMGQSALLDALIAIDKSNQSLTKPLGLVQRPGHFGAVFAPNEKGKTTLYVRGPNEEEEEGILKAVRKHLSLDDSPEAQCDKARQEVNDMIDTLKTRQTSHQLIAHWFPWLRSLIESHNQGRVEEKQDIAAKVMGAFGLKAQHCAQTSPYCQFTQLGYCLENKNTQPFKYTENSSALDRVFATLVEHSARTHYLGVRENVVRQLKKTGVPKPPKQLSLFEESDISTESRNQGHQRLADLILGTEKTDDIPEHWYLTRSGLYGISPASEKNQYRIERLRQNSTLEPYEFKVILPEKMPEIPWKSSLLPALLSVVSDSDSEYQLEILSENLMTLRRNEAYFFAFQMSKKRSPVIHWLNRPEAHQASIQLQALSEKALEQMRKQVEKRESVSVYLNLSTSQKLLWWADKLTCLQGCTESQTLVLSENFSLNQAVITDLGKRIPLPKNRVYRHYNAATTPSPLYALSLDDGDWQLFWLKGDEIMQRQVEVGTAFQQKFIRDDAEANWQERANVLAFLREKTQAQDEILLLSPEDASHWLIRKKDQEDQERFRIFVLAADREQGHEAGTLATKDWDTDTFLSLLPELAKNWGTDSICGKSFKDAFVLPGKGYGFFQTPSKPHFVPTCVLMPNKKTKLVLFLEKNLARDKALWQHLLAQKWPQDEAIRIDQVEGKIFLLQARTRQTSRLANPKQKLDIYYEQGDWEYRDGQGRWTHEPTFHQLYRTALADTDKLEGKLIFESDGWAYTDAIPGELYLMGSNKVWQIKTAFNPNPLTRSDMLSIQSWCEARPERCTKAHRPLLDQTREGKTRFLIAKNEECDATKADNATKADTIFQEIRVSDNSEKSAYTCVATADRWRETVWSDSFVAQDILNYLAKVAKEKNSQSVQLLHLTDSEGAITGYLVLLGKTPHYLLANVKGVTSQAKIDSRFCKNDDCQFKQLTQRQSLLKPFEKNHWDNIVLKSMEKGIYALYEQPGPDFLLRPLNSEGEFPLFSHKSGIEIVADQLYPHLLDYLNQNSMDLSKIEFNTIESDWGVAILEFEKTSTDVILVGDNAFVRDEAKYPPIIVEWVDFKKQEQWHTKAARSIWTLFREAIKKKIRHIRLENCSNDKEQTFVIRAVGFKKDMNSLEQITFLIDDDKNTDLWEKVIDLEHQSAIKQIKSFESLSPSMTPISTSTKRLSISTIKLTKPWCHSKIIKKLIPLLKGSIGEKLYGLTDSGFVLKDSQGKVYWYFNNSSFNQYNNTACVTRDLVTPLEKIIQKGTKMCQNHSGKRRTACTTCIACIADSAVTQKKWQGRFPKPTKKGCF